MTRILLTLSYVGTGYNGWQKQASAPITIQQTLENAIFEATGERVDTQGSGRTDAGVHALAQTCHFDTNSTIPPQKFALVLNNILPPSIRVLSSKAVEDDFNARFFVKRKTYVYYLYAAPFDDPFKVGRAMRVDKMPNIDAMRSASRLLVGEHDFAAFKKSGDDNIKNTVRTIFSLDVVAKGNQIKVEVCGSGFLHNMVRIIVGTLLCVGYDKLSLDDVKDMLISGVRPMHIRFALADGLYLKKVEY